jgi:hypothetical protein
MRHQLIKHLFYHLPPNPIPLPKFFRPAQEVPRCWDGLYLVATHTPGLSATQLARQMGCSYKTAWFLLHRLRRAMVNETRSRLAGQVEADEVIVGGPVRGKKGPGRDRSRTQHAGLWRGGSDRL